MAQPGTIVGGDFRILSPLGKGGMGEVYLAEQLSTAKRRALKLMKPELVGDPTLLARFEQEARVGARIESEHVVEVLAAGVDATTGSPFLAMELLEGESLDRAILRGGPMPPGDVREVLAQLGHGLAAAHRAGVVHRDLKPENVFIAAAKQQGQRFKVKVLDFGIAKLTAEAAHRTQMTMSLGTPRWMAPEQTGGAQPITPATDVWALGLLTYWMLTGRYFWKAAVGGPSDSVMTLMREVLFEPLVPASVRAREQGVAQLLPEGFDAWFARAVAREPSARYSDAAQAVAGIDSLLAVASHSGASRSFVTGGAAWTAQPEDVYGQTVARSLRRPPTASSSWPTIGVAVFVLLAALGAGIGLWFHRERRAAREELERAAEREGRRDAEARKKRRAQQASGEDVDEDDPRPSKPPAPVAAPTPRPVGTGGPGADLSGSWKIALGLNPGGAGRYTGGAVFARFGESYRLTWSMGHEGLAVVRDDLIGVVYGASKNATTGSVLACKASGGMIDCRGSSTARHGAVATHVFQGPGGLSGSYTLVQSSDGRTGSLRLQRQGDVVKASFELRGWPPESGTGIVKGEQLAVGLTAGHSPVGVVLYEASADALTGLWLPPNGAVTGHETLRRP